MTRIWPVFTPLAALAALAVPATPTVFLLLALFGATLAAVHHAEVVALRVGEPLGTLVLAVAVTVLEVGLIAALMFSGGAETQTLARDTVFAAVMIILNGVVGASLLFGGIRHGEQSFGLPGVSTALTTLTAIVVLTLILPNFTTSIAGPIYSPSQLAFIGIVCLILYGTFLLVQTVRHRDYFLPEDTAAEHAARPSPAAAWTALGLLVLSLAAVILLAKGLAPEIARTVATLGAPQAFVGVVIALIVLLPEGVAAVRAARADRLQTSLNLGLGSALATIGLTVPAVAALSLAMGWTLILGLNAKSMVLLALTLIVTTLSLGTGRTTVMQGAVHLVIFAVFVFTTLVP